MANELMTWDERLAKHAQKQAAVERPSIGRLGFRSGQMTYQGTPIAGNTLNAIILASVTEHALYANVAQGRPWDPNKPESPVCFSLNEENTDAVPHPNSKQRMAPACKECAYNAWASDPVSVSRGGRAKACKDLRRLLLLPQTAIISPANQAQDPSNIAKTECATCTLPVTSVRNWANYLSGLSGSLARPSWAVLTKISVVPHPKTQFEVKFETAFQIPEMYFAALEARIPEAVRLLMTPYSQDASPKS